MDPTECLRLILSAAKRGDVEQLLSAVIDLGSWLSKGGFPPEFEKLPQEERADVAMFFLKGVVTRDGQADSNVQRLVEAARFVLNSAIDTDAFGPEEQDIDGEDDEYPRDADGDAWYSDLWELSLALDYFDDAEDKTEESDGPDDPNKPAGPTADTGGQ